MEFFVEGKKKPGMDKPPARHPVVMHDITFEPAADQEEMIQKHMDHYRKEMEKTFGGEMISLDIVIKVRSWSFERRKNNG